MSPSEQSLGHGRGIAQGIGQVDGPFLPQPGVMTRSAARHFVETVHHYGAISLQLMILGWGR